MRTFKTILLLNVFVLCGALVSAQSADDIISNYVKAIGGKNNLSKIQSLYAESEVDIMGMVAIQKATILNGKGYKMEMEINGEIIINCVTENGGWIINPLEYITTAEDMPEDQYDEVRAQIFVGGPFTVAGDLGYKVEVLGNETIGNVDAVKVQLTTPGGATSVHFFDLGTGYLIQSIQEADMQGQMVETVISFSDYKEVDGIRLPHTTSADIAEGMFVMTMNITKVEVNKEVDPAIFIKP
jgi:hypothetical protein